MGSFQSWGPSEVSISVSLVSFSRCSALNLRELSKDRRSVCKQILCKMEAEIAEAGGAHTSITMEARKLEHDYRPTPNLKKEEHQHGSSSFLELLGVYCKESQSTRKPGHKGLAELS